MHKIEYEINLNDIGRPYIELPKEYQNVSDDKFFVIELARYFLHEVSKTNKSHYDIPTLAQLDNTIALLGQISDSMAEIVYGGMIAEGEVDMIFKSNSKYHCVVNSYDDLYKHDNMIVYDGKIYKLVDKLRVFVIEDSCIYKYVNNNWTKLDE